MIHKMPELPYAQHALEPIMSAETLSFHFGKHLQTYLDNVNKLIVGTPYAEMPLKEIIAKLRDPYITMRPRHGITSCSLSSSPHSLLP